ITALAALETFMPPLPADTAVALGAFLAGRGRLNLWTVFGLTWAANVASASAVYWLARRYGRDFFKGPTGRRLLTPPVLAHIEAQYQRHGTYGIFVSRLLPVWRAVVPPPPIYAGGFAAGYGAHRLLPIRLWLEPTVVQSLLGWGLLVGGVLLAVSAAYLFRRAGTTPNPARPTSALVIRGPYRVTRNP